MNSAIENERLVTVQIVNAFVQDGQGGNPAGVLLDADGLSDDDMQTIAAGMGLSETAFVSKSATEGFKLDFFTPNRRIPHCGHATIAAFSLLLQNGRVGDGETSKETVDGPRKIVIKDGKPFMEQLAPRFADPEAWNSVTLADVLSSLSLTEDDLDPRAKPSRVDTGNGSLQIGVKSDALLRALSPDQDAIAKISAALDIVGFYVFTTDDAATPHDAAARMFAPHYGIPEEAATGMMAGALAGYLYERVGIRKPHFVIEQGGYMDPPSPSLLTVELDLLDGAIQGLMAGGSGKVMDRRTVQF
ncbi:PhzF family phenazine biosynthesis protein [Hwanghaeella grinnelliae]|uniref:PhzF family phenazine biosynthesis protein n=1 Tax=Hwanghaeella grinnelliae TaxID=2500179 RepID=A0A3S2VQA4_9PROT|nr:PhzF family phenazine biosynthesis protein [Hwanghaeella grinnelliae]RVU36492.1 PhzF family phenazine biosynthesis protein [Hwanghaeella grinnelliae]